MRFIVLFASLLSVAAWANPIIYPAQGQTPEQQRKDQVECQLWATDTTGVDPIELAGEAAPARQEVGGERARGALGGAAKGAIIGAIAGDAGKGAAIGAGVGVLSGGAKQRRKSEHNEQMLEQNQQRRQEQMELYDRAFKACMEGKGYSVS
ncbi:glycine zipper family protein [Ferrimonas gelatinilytica]|uniref:Glycine-zipper-containing OmpA-like membrane domain-containing protein n=1 Tax=Ferrimonas gelatinilytica TaxID=1255257 RepID=A0ABP9RVH7_9GAMM